MIQIIQQTDEEKMAMYMKLPKKKIIEILGFYNKSNPKTELYLPYIEKAISQAKLLNNPEEDYPLKLGSFVYKIIESLRKH